MSAGAGAALAIAFHLREAAARSYLPLPLRRAAPRSGRFMISFPRAGLEKAHRLPGKGRRAPPRPPPRRAALTGPAIVTRTLPRAAPNANTRGAGRCGTRPRGAVCGALRAVIRDPRCRDLAGGGRARGSPGGNSIPPPGRSPVEMR